MELKYVYDEDGNKCVVVVNDKCEDEEEDVKGERMIKDYKEGGRNLRDVSLRLVK